MATRTAKKLILGSLLRQLRLVRKLSYTQAFYLVELSSVNRIWMLETGRAHMRYEQFVKCMNDLGYTVNLTLTDGKNDNKVVTEIVNLTQLK